MSLKPWYKVVTPREDLREGRPLDASEFAVHLDHVRDGRAGPDYQDPRRFLDRTFLTKNLSILASQTLRRLSGETTETSAVFNMSTQFGGGKTHALTLLYHLARGGPQAKEWPGVADLLLQAGVKEVPQAATAVFVGTEFDSLQGRGGADGTPLRKTPWGEIAFQLGGAEGFARVAEHDQRQESPAGDVIRNFFPANRPCLILMDELMNYVSRNRKTGLASQFYHFLQNLSETVRGERQVVLVVSIPASEMEMTVEDQSEFSRLKKLLDRLGKAIVISGESESSEIIRRRLFEWKNQTYTSQNGQIILGNKDAIQTCHEYADWVVDHKQQLPALFPADQAREVFKACYPFHPMVLSVFERKWQSLPRFQQTRGVLRLLAQWVSHAYQAGFKGAHKDALIGLGSAPLEDSLFRRAVFEQLGEERLESAITTDICGKTDSFAIRMDSEAAEPIKKARLHRKVATTIFFESSGGQQSKVDSTLPEIRLATGEPEQDIGHVETVLEELATNCYYLTVEKNRYSFSLTPNLNKLLSDRRASIQQVRIEERVRTQIQEVFATQRGIERVFFPDLSNMVPDRPVITLVIASPEQTINHQETLSFAERVIREAGQSGRTYKSALIWAVADSTTTLFEETRKWLAWEDIDKEDRSKLDDPQCRQLTENLTKAKRDTREAVWRSYKHIVLLGHDNTLRTIDLGLVHSSASESMVNLILSRLRQEDLIAERVNANFLLRNWPPAMVEWSTRSVRDTFFASPKFPRLFAADVIKDTIARGVTEGLLALVGKAEGRYEPFLFGEDLDAHEVEFSDDLFILTAAEAKKRKEPPKLKYLKISPEFSQVPCGKSLAFTVRGLDQHGQDFSPPHLTWQATGGSVSDKGVFLAGSSEGEFTVTVDNEGISATARIAVHQEIPPKIGTKPPDGTAPPSSKSLSWNGEIPHQKWMQFYNKVLSRFVLTGGLKITVNFDVASEESISPERLEEIRVAMRDLGVDDRISKK